MKFLLLFAGLLAASISPVAAQSRLSLAPVYWFSYNPYSYQSTISFNGVTTQTPIAGHTLASSFGLALRYDFTPKLDLSVGGLFNRTADHIQIPRQPYGDSGPFISKGIQVPVLISYRLTDKRLSPYFSAGALFTKSKTFTEAPIKADGIIGIGLTYRFDPGVSLLLQPTAGYPLTRPASDAFYRVDNYSSYSFGIQTQLIWRF